MTKHKIDTENLEMLQNLVASIPIAIVIFRDDVFVATNQRYLDYIGPDMAPYCKEGISLRDYVAHIHECMIGEETSDPEDDELRRTDKTAWIEKRLHIYRNDSDFEDRDGNGWWRIINKYYPADKTYVGIRVDIKDIKESQAKAAAADHAKSQFLANMSHEIRTPMNGILGMAELLSTVDLDPKHKDFVSVIQRSGNALLTIINDILDFSKIEAGQLEVVPEPFILRDSVEDVMTLVAPKMTSQDVDLLLRVQPDLPIGFKGDAGRLRQVLTNIIGNAVKFTHDGHILVDISGSVNDGVASLNFRVEDTGIGIPEDKLGAIFDKFNQADISTTREYGGTGLGLNIARELVQLMGGDILLKSEVGKGSEFSFTIDLPVETTLRKQVIEDLNVRDAKILVVDDNPDNRNILTEQLSYWGCKSVAVDSAYAAVNVLKRAAEKGFSFDLIVLDYHMPKVNGEGFVKAIKKHASFSQIPVIMLSSVDRSDLQKRMSEHGIEAFLTKPARASVFLNLINDTLYKKRQEQKTTTQSEEAPAQTNSVQATDTASQKDRSSDVAVSVHRDTPMNDAKCFTKASAKENGEGGSDTQVSEKTGINEASTSTPQVDILIADDNEVNRIYAQYLMEELGYSFELVCDGVEAVEAWKRLRPKIVLMDVSMPNMNGYEATANIRAAEKAEGVTRTPIIAVTAHSLKGDKEKCLEQDMDGYLAKPVSIAGLKQCLADWNVSCTIEVQAA